MGFLRGLDERFEQKHDEIYAGVRDAKDDAALHPIIIISPDDPNRRQGVGQSDRLVPIQRIATDEVRMTRFLTSPRGLKFLLGQQLLQTGNVISETRLLNPLFINLNLTPNDHFNRQLRDQTDIIIGDVARSPASTAEIGLAGRLQKETAAEALLSVIGRGSGRSILSLITGQVGGTLAGTIGIGNDVGTFGINERPEIKIGPDSLFYSTLLRTGYEQFAQRELSILTSALQAAGVAGSVFGFPNIFSGLTDSFVNPIPSQTEQMRYGVDDATEATRYLPASVRVPRPILLSPTSVRISKAAKGIVFLQAGFGLAGLIGGTAIRRISTSLSAATNIAGQLFAAQANRVSRIVPQTDDLVSELLDRTNVNVADQLTFPESALENTYVADDRLKFVRDALAEQAELIQRYTDNIKSDRNPNRGIAGGITLEKLQTINASNEAGIDSFGDTEKAQQYFGSLDRREISPGSDETAPGYYHDTLNLVRRLEGTEGFLPENDNTGQLIPIDYINITIYDKINDRLEPFRAIVMGISETITPEFNANRYVGRIERNIVYLGATRQLSFTLIVHAWSAIELEAVWDKINFITGLAFPSKVSGDGFLLPPIVELTIGDMYVQQPGYFTSIVHTIQDGTSWEIDRGAQVPHTIEMGLTFDVIEKESMTASSPFYGFGIPVTA